MIKVQTYEIIMNMKMETLRLKQQTVDQLRFCKILVAETRAVEYRLWLRDPSGTCYAGLGGSLEQKT